MGIISDALKKAGRERGSARRYDPASEDAPIVDVPTFGGLLGGERDEASTGEDRAHTILASMPGLDERIVTVRQSEGMEAEQFRALRTRLLNQNPDNEHRVIAVTSSAPREGKSLTTVNLAFALAELKHLRVCLVDGDVRRGCLSQMLSLPPEQGLADMIREDLPCLPLRSLTPNLSYLAPGNMGDENAAEILSSAVAQNVFDDLRKRFHYVLVDTPPVNTVADVGIIGQNCYGVIMIVRMHHTHEPMAKRAVKQLQANNVNILGCVALGRHDDAGAYGYYYDRYYNYYR
ncbi:MAG: CpsD/CapB family tyrosine-protein kinase [Phycisphaerales bacterium]|nr:MAG: CpsD/CapB family tyrosine-protein kinase [Phycisphaerales bacterium]